MKDTGPEGLRSTPLSRLHVPAGKDAPRPVSILTDLNAALPSVPPRAGRLRWIGVGALLAALGGAALVVLREVPPAASSLLAPAPVPAIEPGQISAAAAPALAPPQPETARVASGEVSGGVPAARIAEPPPRGAMAAEAAEQAPAPAGSPRPEPVTRRPDRDAGRKTDRPTKPQEPPRRERGPGGKPVVAKARDAREGHAARPVPPARVAEPVRQPSARAVERDVDIVTAIVR